MNPFTNYQERSLALCTEDTLWELLEWGITEKAVQQLISVPRS